jgi:hypothetical protein
MARISESLREQVTERAKGYCEYCQTAKVIVTTMEVDHIQPEARGGATHLDNLCLVCRGCNSFKHDFVEGIDPETLQEARLYHPRLDKWLEHFRWSEDGLELIGLTSVGRATIVRLRMNRPEILASRKLWVQAGWHPPKLE